MATKSTVVKKTTRNRRLPPALFHQRDSSLEAGRKRDDQDEVICYKAEQRDVTPSKWPVLEPAD